MAYDKVLSADGEELQRRKARATSRKYKSFSTEMQSVRERERAWRKANIYLEVFTLLTSYALCLIGLLGVPFLWVVHLWYFWPEIRKPNGDPYIKRSKSHSLP